MWQQRDLLFDRAHLVCLFTAVNMPASDFNTNLRTRHSRKASIVTGVYPVVDDSWLSSSIGSTWAATTLRRSGIVPPPLRLCSPQAWPFPSVSPYGNSAWQHVNVTQAPLLWFRESSSCRRICSAACSFKLWKWTLPFNVVKASGGEYIYPQDISFALQDFLFFFSKMFL